MTYLRDHSPMRNRILRETEAALEKVWDKLFDKIEREMIRQVAKWESRWPRHKFRMALMHGYLHVYVDPPVMGTDIPSNIGSLWARGSILDLQEEIEKFDDFLCDIASEMGRPADGLDTKHPTKETP